MIKALLTIALMLQPVFALAQSTKIRIGYLPVTNQTELIADELGLYKKHGLDVELVLFQTGPAAIQGLLSGDLQAVESAVVASLNLARQGIPLYFLTTGGMNTPATPAGTIIVRPDESRIKSFSDLKGRKIAQLGKGTITHLRLLSAIRMAELQPSDVAEIHAPFPAMGGLLQSGQVDAAYAWPPYDTIMLQMGQGKLLTTDAAWNPYSVINVFTVRKDWADKNEKSVRQLVRVNVEANRWINSHPERARDILGRRLKLQPKVAAEMRMFHFPRNGYQLMPSIWENYFLMVSSGQMKPLPSPSAVIESYWIDPARKFIQPVLDEMGIEEDRIANEMLNTALPNLPQPVQTYWATWEKTMAASQTEAQGVKR